MHGRCQWGSTGSFTLAQKVVILPNLGNIYSKLFKIKYRYASYNVRNRELLEDSQLEKAIDFVCDPIPLATK